jgi:hypothetical protein
MSLSFSKRDLIFWLNSTPWVGIFLGILYQWESISPWIIGKMSCCLFSPLSCTRRAKGSLFLSPTQTWSYRRRKLWLSCVDSQDKRSSRNVFHIEGHQEEKVIIRMRWEGRERLNCQDERKSQEEDCYIRQEGYSVLTKSGSNGSCYESYVGLCFCSSPSFISSSFSEDYLFVSSCPQWERERDSSLSLALSWLCLFFWMTHHKELILKRVFKLLLCEL